MTGTGTQNDPYLISTYEDLKALANVNKDNMVYVKLTDNIIVDRDSMDNFTGLGTGWHINFDGNNKYIKNLKYFGEANWGFFGSILSGEIYDLELRDLYITVTGNGNTASGLATTVSGDSYLENIKITGIIQSLKGTASGVVYSFGSTHSRLNKVFVKAEIIGTDVYGICRTAQSTQFENCKSNSRLNATATNGNACGFALNGRFLNCESACEIINGKSIAGFTLQAEVNGTFVNCYSHSSYLGSGATTIYGFGSGAVIQNCYYDNSVLTVETLDGGLGVPTKDLQDPEWLREHFFAI